MKAQAKTSSNTKRAMGTKSTKNTKTTKSRKTTSVKAATTKTRTTRMSKSGATKSTSRKSPTKSRRTRATTPRQTSFYHPKKSSTSSEGFKFFSAQRTPAGQFTIAVLTIVLFVTGIIFTATSLNIDTNSTITNTRHVQSDAELFAAEYPEVEHSELFDIRTAEEIIGILEHGTGVVYLGFPECPWCKAYVPMLADLAVDVGIDQIFYLNVLEDRSNNTEEYQKIVEILGDRLQYNNEGQRHLYVPDVVFVVNGEIIGNDYETSKDLKGTKTPEEYWTPNRVAVWSGRIRNYLNQVKAAAGCTDTCNV